MEGVIYEYFCTGGMERTQCIPEMNWSNGVQFIWRESRKGDCANLGFVVDEGGKYSVKCRFTIAPDYGRFSVEVNESPVLPSVDTYNSKLSMMTVELGILELKKGENFLKLVQLDKNEKAVNSLIGLDYLTVEKVK